MTGNGISKHMNNVYRTESHAFVCIFARICTIRWQSEGVEMPYAGKCHQRGVVKAVPKERRRGRDVDLTNPTNGDDTHSNQMQFMR